MKLLIIIAYLVICFSGSSCVKTNLDILKDQPNKVTLTTNAFYPESEKEIVLSGEDKKKAIEIFLKSLESKTILKKEGNNTNLISPPSGLSMLEISFESGRDETLFISESGEIRPYEVANELDKRWILQLIDRYKK